jgi:hypothetical protein
MMFGEWGNQDHEESIRIIDRALGAGINFIDTADVYGQGESEVIVGTALAGGKRDDGSQPAARQPPTSSSTRPYSAASTRSSRPARPSIPPTTPGTTPRSRPPRGGAER